MMKLNFLGPRITLILAGIGLGLVARFILGVPEDSTTPKREINRPLPEVKEDVMDLPILKNGSISQTDDERGHEQGHDQDEAVSGLVPPIALPGQMPNKPLASRGLRLTVDTGDDFPHDPTAIFHAHGHQVCASGCATSNHPTAILSEDRFWELIDEYKLEPMDQTNNALEALLYFGPQTKKMIVELGVGTLDQERSEFLWKQLACTSARVSLRVVDQNGEVRTWLDPTLVPFDRRHVFDMKTKDLQPLVTSGTVKRVGLNHAWVRL